MFFYAPGPMVLLTLNISLVTFSGVVCAITLHKESSAHHIQEEASVKRGSDGRT